MNAYYYKIDVIPESLPPYEREARIFAHSADNALYILTKSVWETFGTHYRVLRQHLQRTDDYSPILTAATKGSEGYFQFTDYEISIDLLLPFVPVNCRTHFIDSFIDDL